MAHETGCNAGEGANHREAESRNKLQSSNSIPACASRRICVLLWPLNARALRTPRVPAPVFPFGGGEPAAASSLIDGEEVVFAADEGSGGGGPAAFPTRLCG